MAWRQPADEPLSEPIMVSLVMHICVTLPQWVNTLRPRQNGRHFAEDTFNRVFVNENVRISIEFSLMFVPKGPINNIQALVQIMAWRRPGAKPLSEPVMVSLLTHICVTRPQWFKRFSVWEKLNYSRQNVSRHTKQLHLIWMSDIICVRQRLCVRLNVIPVVVILLLLTEIS